MNPNLTAGKLTPSRRLDASQQIPFEGLTVALPLSSVSGGVGVAVQSGGWPGLMVRWPGLVVGGVVAAGLDLFH